MASIIEDALMGQDLDNLLEHIAWGQIVQPELLKHKSNYETLLVQSVLGQQIINQSTNQIISKEMLAGRIEGINWIMMYLKNVLSKGVKAQEKLAAVNMV